MDCIEEKSWFCDGVEGSTAGHLYNSSKMSVRGGAMQEGFALSKAAGTYKEEAE